MADLNGSNRGEERTGVFRGGGSADVRARRTVPRPTWCLRASARIDMPSTRASRRIAANSSTRTLIPKPTSGAARTAGCGSS